MASSISGDDIRIVMRYYAVPSAADIEGVRMVNLLKKERISLFCRPYPALLVDVQAHLVGAEGVGEDERVDSHCL